ncbi:iron complex outermembrane receptor protein [Pelomonas saccharophila]|uniref:Iron complex outermembrane receptor protein n=1 Tax=Roseateles saccharophilus TaxID=304 RepID=A0ABU1YMI8_ROSSA|nr:TonB-dependent receptor [Roseateles saccharophilus]MDR7270055.1 iron complex outermembrane receptor protein [Roseateles saccharophilus]
MSRFLFSLALLCASALSVAQTAPKPPAPAASAAANKLDRVEVSGGPTANSRRRNSTASKIVIEREDLDRYGDTVLGDVLRRLPGVTIGGRPGRGGDIRMRGLGAGFTQILVDGERAPAGFAVEDLPPDQVERIEIYRAPTAETGARAIAGTINIILREPLQKSDHELRFTLGRDRGEPQADFSWTRNLKWGGPNADEFVGAMSVNGGLHRRFNNIDSHNRVVDTDTGEVLNETVQQGSSVGNSSNLNGNARLRWKFSDTLSFNLAPFFALSQNEGHSQNNAVGFTRFRDVHSEFDGRMHNLRLNLSASYRPAVGETWDFRIGRGGFKNTSNSQRHESLKDVGIDYQRVQDDRNVTDEDQTSLGAKWSLKTAKEHQWVTGLEHEQSQRTQVRRTLIDGLESPALQKFGDTLGSSSQRFAGYTQDEWSPSKIWSVYAGIRYERIETRSDAAGLLPDTRNVSQVTSPLFHLLWKPEAFPKDQVRLSLTRSYRSPNLNDLIARPTINTTYPTGPNLPTYADRAGNPDLRPELATGVDLSLEHWLPTGGIVSGSAFVRDIKSLIRSRIDLETVPWDSTSQRWVSRPRNLEGARTMGVEFEVKARLDEVWEEAPPEWQLLLLRFNVAVFDSKVKGIPGSNARLDQQPRGSLNFGLDHRWKALGQNFGSGFNFNYVPGTRVQQTENLRREETSRRQLDAYLSWASGSVRDGINWRLSLANLLPRDAQATSEATYVDPLTSHNLVTDTWSRNTTFRVISLRADMRF